MLIVGHREVRNLLDGHDKEVLELVADAYRLHDEGRTALPTRSSCVSPRKTATASSDCRRTWAATMRWPG